MYDCTGILLSFWFVIFFMVFMCVRMNNQNCIWYTKSSQTINLYRGIKIIAVLFSVPFLLIPTMKFMFFIAAVQWVDVFIELFTMTQNLFFRSKTAKIDLNGIIKKKEFFAHFSFTCKTLHSKSNYMVAESLLELFILIHSRTQLIHCKWQDKISKFLSYFQDMGESNYH